LGGLQLGAVQLSELGRMVSFYSQKYLMVSVLAIVFVAVEHHSYMEKTQWLGNLDVMKLGVVVLFAGALVISLVQRPITYRTVHAGIQDALDQQVKTISTSDDRLEEGAILRDTQEFLENHDINWVYVKTLTGYGNILTLIIVGGALLVQRLFFKDTWVRKFVDLMLPEFIVKAAAKATNTFGFKRSPDSQTEPPAATQ
jgi:hypothetical protein